MASVRFTHDEETHLTEITVSGQLSVDHIMHYSEKFYSRYSSPLVLWDAREATFKPITEEDMQRIVLSLKELAKSRHRGKTAFVSNSDVEKNNTKLFSKFATEAGCTISYKNFTDIESAKSWLIPADGDEDFELVF